MPHSCQPALGDAIGHLPVPQVWLCHAWKYKCGMEELKGTVPGPGARLWVGISVPSLVSCVTLSKSLDLSVPFFLSIT